MDGPGVYQISLYDSSLAYSVEKFDAPTTRTLIFIKADVDKNEWIYLRAGIDWMATIVYQDRDCAEMEEAKWRCAISITHRVFRDKVDRTNDRWLDWHGAEIS